MGPAEGPAAPRSVYPSHTSPLTVTPCLYEDSDLAWAWAACLQPAGWPDKSGRVPMSRSPPKPRRQASSLQSGARLQQKECANTSCLRTQP